jgi:transposase
VLGHRDRSQDELFISGSLSSLIPEDYILKRVDHVLDLSWLRAEVEDLYCTDNGRPGIDPEAAVRLMLAGFFHGIVHDRKLMREAQMHLGIRWFAGFSLHESLPDHSSLTRLRQRWGVERFRRIFERTVAACIKAGLVSGQTVHVDATLIRADVSWESMVVEHTERVWEENVDATGGSETAPAPKRTSRTGKPKKRSATDPDATITTGSQEFRMQPAYKQHTAVDDQSGVVIDAEVTTGETSEGSQLLEQLGRIEKTLGAAPQTVTADAAYAHPRNYGALERRGIQAIIPPQFPSRCAKTFPQSRFHYDALHDIVRCPAGKKLHRGNNRCGNGWFYYSRARDCRLCPLRSECLAPSARKRSVLIGDEYPALLRARRKRLRWDESVRAIYRRHRWMIEGRHGEAKNRHGLVRAVRRRLHNVQIQAYLTAAVMNLKRLANALTGPGGPTGAASGLIYMLQRLVCRMSEAISVCQRIHWETRTN